MPTRSPRGLLVVVMGVGLLALCLATTDAEAAAADDPVMAALGDSLTRAWGSSGGPGDSVGHSWSTGTDPDVRSHFVRLLPELPGLTAKNLAKSGTKIAATNAQADQAVAAAAGYVTILSGTNDVCTPATADMTSVPTFRARIRTTLEKLSHIPGSKILVASIPDWYALWSDFKDVSAAASVWAARGTCPTIFGAGTTTADRQAARERIDRFNDALAETCAEFDSCTFDGRALHSLRFRQNDLAFDFFHFGVAGQARVAAALWSVSPLAPAPAPGNLAPNARFEKRPFGTYVTSGRARFRWSERRSRSPSHSLAIASRGAGKARWSTRKRAIRAVPGQAYRARVWVRSRAVRRSVKLVLTFWTASGSRRATVRSTGRSGTHRWKKLTVTKTAPRRSAFVRISMLQRGKGKSWWDDASLVAAGR